MTDLLDPTLDDKLRVLDSDARNAFHELPYEKKEKSLKAKTFIIYPFEVKFNQEKSFEEKEKESFDEVNKQFTKSL